MRLLTEGSCLHACLRLFKDRSRMRWVKGAPSLWMFSRHSMHVRGKIKIFICGEDLQNVQSSAHRVSAECPCAGNATFFVTKQGLFGSRRPRVSETNLSSRSSVYLKAASVPSTLGSVEKELRSDLPHTNSTRPEQLHATNGVHRCLQRI